MGTRTMLTDCKGILEEWSGFVDEMCLAEEAKDFSRFNKAFRNASRRHSAFVIAAKASPEDAEGLKPEMKRLSERLQEAFEKASTWKLELQEEHQKTKKRRVNVGKIGGAYANSRSPKTAVKLFIKAK